MVVTDRQTDRPRYSVCSKGPHLASAAMRPNNNNHNTNANVYGAVIMAMAMAIRVIHAYSVTGDRQPSDQANRLRL